MNIVRSMHNMSQHNKLHQVQKTFVLFWLIIKTLDLSLAYLNENQEQRPTIDFPKRAFFQFNFFHFIEDVFWCGIRFCIKFTQNKENHLYIPSK